MKMVCADQPAGIDYKFLVLFTAYLGIFVGLALIPRSIYDVVERFTASVVASFWSAFMPVSRLGNHVTFYDFTMEIIFECTGLHYAVIYAAAVLAFPGRTALNKAGGLLFGISMIFLLNLLRIGMLGVIGHYYADFFPFLHLYLWHAVFSIAVFLLWVRWLNGKVDISWQRINRFLIGLAAAFLSFWLMFSFINYYYSFLAFLADTLFPLLGGVMSMPRSVIAEKDLIGYITGNYVISSTSGLYTLNFAVYIAVAAFMTTRRADMRLFPIRFLTGCGLMIVSHLGLLLMDWSLETTSSDTVKSALTWSIVLSSMIAPLVSWACASMLVRSGAKKITSPE